MDIKYYKEFQHNYMVIRCDDKKNNGYQQKILTRQKLKHIFPCDIRYMNGESFYYYEITSKVCIANLYQNMKCNRENVIKLFHDLEEAMNELSSYLLDDMHLMLETDYIYYDYEKDKYIFLYYPDYETQSQTYEELLTFILDRMDVEDKELTDFMYQICGEIGTGSLSMYRINKMLSNMVESEKEVNSIEAINVTECNDNISILEYQASFTNSVDSYNEEKAEEKRTKQFIFSIVLIMLAVIGELIVGFVYFLFITTATEKVILIASGVTCLIMLMLGILLLVREKKMKRRKDELDLEQKAMREDDFGLYNNNLEVHVNDFIQKRTSNMLEKNECASSGEQNQTTFFHEKKSVEEYKLFATDRTNKQHISLFHLPCVIGKMAGCVDVCLKDPSVSRMHARIERQGDQLFIQDINSTNGTYLNGIRLEPNEKMEITLGDEIRIGNLNYSVR